MCETLKKQGWMATNVNTPWVPVKSLNLATNQKEKLDKFNWFWLILLESLCAIENHYLVWYMKFKYVLTMSITVCRHDI